MNRHETELLEALQALDDAVRAISTAGAVKPALQPIFERIDTVAEAGRGALDPQLMHYIQRRSYEKALAWLREAQ